MIQRSITVLFMLVWFSLHAFSQINSINDFVEKTQELRTISQKLGTYYILTQLYPTNEKFAKTKDENIQTFNNLVVELTENAPSEELSIEMQKFNLTWLYVNKILSQKYDRMAASKILDKLEDMQHEAQNITDMVLKLTKKKQAEVVEKASDTRVQIQRMILYFLANRARIMNKNINSRFEDSKNKFRTHLSYLERTEFNDENTLMILEMVKNQYKSYGKNITLDNKKISPLTVVMVSERMDEDLKLLVRTYKEILD